MKIDNKNSNISLSDIVKYGYLDYENDCTITNSMTVKELIDDWLNESEFLGANDCELSNTFINGIEYSNGNDGKTIEDLMENLVKSTGYRVNEVVLSNSSKELVEKGAGHKAADFNQGTAEARGAERIVYRMMLKGKKNEFIHDMTDFPPKRIEEMRKKFREHRADVIKEYGLGDGGNSASASR